MDRGAARSRKRSQPTNRPSQSEPEAGPSSVRQSGHNAGSGRDRQAEGVHPSRQGRPGAVPFDPLQRGERLPRPRKQLIDEATRYKPKAIRSAAALIWSEAPFAIPPPKDVLQGVRRFDLAGSGVTDVSWLQGSGVTWLNLAGCEIGQGWEAVGSLKDLSVLNISNCQLSELPASLSGLVNLKALVAMGNDWTAVDETVVAAWTELNSLIISHSPSLSTLPSSLNQLYHLSKLTFSHCPSLSASSLPDLSPLPALRDVKMNNLPLLTSLPSHLATWGTGDLSLSRKRRTDTEVDQPGESSVKRYGEGLEVLDLGNCSLPFSAIEPVFIKPKSAVKGSFSHLRSLTLHSNPLGTTHPAYADLLQASTSLPNLQIIDSKRVIERKRKGEISETRKERAVREKRAAKMKPSGANVGGTSAMRQWGTETGATIEQVDQADISQAASDGKKSKKRKADAGEPVQGQDGKAEKSKKRKGETASDGRKHGDREHGKSKATSAKHKQPDTAGLERPAAPAVDLSADPSASAAISMPAAGPAKAAHMPIAPKEPVYQVIDLSKKAGKEQKKAEGEEKVSRAERRVKQRKEKAQPGYVEEKVEQVKAGPVDLKTLFGAKGVDAVEEDSGLGLGVGGW